MIAKADGRIMVFPGGGITERNLAKIVTRSGAQECHSSARATVPSRMTYRRSGVHMGGALRLSEFDLSVSDAGHALRLKTKRSNKTTRQVLRPQWQE